MSKGNGGTRGSNPKSMYGNGSTAQAEEGLSAATYDRIVNTIASGEYPTGWDDLDEGHRELALMEAGFTGLADDGAENIMFEDKRDDLLGWIADNVVSDALNYQHDDNVTATIGYKDGTRKNFDAMSNDFDIGNAGRSSSHTLYDRAFRQFDRRNISYVIYSDASNTRYYANGESGMKQIKDYTGYEKWTKGRGEKRRDYIQDDWI